MIVLEQAREIAIQEITKILGNPNSFGLIGADLITLNAMLRIPVDFHNIDRADCFRPTFWDRCGGDDFRACETLGPLYR